MLGVLWLLVQHEPVVLLTQNVFLIVAIVSLILYSMVHTKQDHNNTVAYTIAGIAMVSGTLCGIAKPALHSGQRGAR